MANRHYGNWGDVFKHLALAEILEMLQPHEYWESHAGAACNAWGEAGENVEREHGIRYFAAHYEQSAALRGSAYGRRLANITEAGKLAFVPGSPWLAMKALGAEARRYLLCDTDAASLQDVAKVAGEMKIPPAQVECIQEDGVMIVRGACVVLAENWTRDTLALIDPYDVLAPTAAEIHALGLWCEVASRGIPAVLWYGFDRAEQGAALHGQFTAATEKARLGRNNVRMFEAVLRDGGTGGELPTLLGCGLLTANLPEGVVLAVHERCRALSELYAGASLAGCASGAIKYVGRAG